MQTIEPISLTVAAKRLRLNKAELRGVLKGMGIKLPEFGRAKMMDAATLQQIERHLASFKAASKSA